MPRESNNHRPKILHHQSLLFVVAIFFVGQLLLGVLRTNFSNVLGTSTDISSQTLLLLTNQYREKNGLVPLYLNSELSQAALSKAQNMFVKNYWAHTAPDGTTPWIFVRQAGYDYVYAGENLARGFTTSDDIVTAWMASPTHRENMLSGNYQDVGFAVMEGTLLGENTTLIVEMFGNKNFGTLARRAESEKNLSPLAKSPQSSPETFGIAIKSKPIMDSFFLSKHIVLSALFIFISILILDMIIIERKKVARLVGHNLDHIFFLSLLLVFAVMIGKGTVL